MYVHSKHDVTVFASKLASIAGMHPYYPQLEIANELARFKGHNPFWKSCNELAVEELNELPDKYVAELDILRNKTFCSAKQAQVELEAMKETFVEKPKKLGKMLKKLEDDECDAIEKVVHGCHTIANLETRSPEFLKALDLAKEVKGLVCVPEQVLSLVTSEVYTKHGTQQEDGIRKQYSENQQIQVDHKNKFFPSNEPFIVIDELEVYLGGRHDGMTSDGKLIEIKTRQRRFLGTPLYELVQVHAYMFIYGLDQAQLIESYLGEQRIHNIQFDHVLWDTIKENTKMFFEDHYLTQNTANN